MLGLLGDVATLPTIRLGLKFILLSMVRKSELQDGVWDEVDFENAVWSIPKERMKRSRPHNVYLSTQMLDILIALKTCAGNSHYILPSRYDADAPMSRATFNRVTTAIAERAEKNGLRLRLPHRRTSSACPFDGSHAWPRRTQTEPEKGGPGAMAPDLRGSASRSRRGSGGDAATGAGRGSQGGDRRGAADAGAFRHGTGGAVEGGYWRGHPPGRAEGIWTKAAVSVCGAPEAGIGFSTES